MARRFTPAAMPFACRHGISSLHRPHNRTTLLTLALGLGVFLALTISLTQHNLQNRLLAETSTEGGNTVLFDIQPGQLEGVMTLFEEENLPILQHAPVVTMRLSEVNGTPVRQLLTRRDLDMPRWVLRREYRSTYRSELDQAEVLVAGAWEPRAEHPERDVPISIEESIAGHLSVGLGDELVFDIQGVPIHTRIASIRAVEWRQVRPNFFVVFPSGVLEEAPGFHVLVTRVNSSEQSARLQNRMGERYPNVSTIDLSLVLETLDSILSKISVVIYFLTGFIAATGMLVLISVLLTGRHQRISDVALLRTLGASRKQVMQVLAVEYLSLGLLAAAAGTLLAVGASWLLAKYLFHTGFLLSFTPILVAWLAAGLTTLAVGLALSRGVTRPAPLVVLQGSL